MKTAQSKQTGFSVIEGMLAALVLVALAGVSFTVYQRVKSSATTTDAATNPNQSTNQQPVTTTPAPTVSYLTIKEWGVKLPLSDSIKDAYYTFKGSNNGSDGLPNTAWLGLTSLNTNGCDISTTGPSSTNKPIGSILRVLPTDQDPVTGSPYKQEYPNGVTIGSYYYGYAPWKNNTCTSAASLQSIDTGFANAAKSTAASTN